MSLTGKTAVVTGGGRGLGRATAIRLARDGAAVAVWGRTLAPLEETVSLIAAAGGKAVACTGDASVKADIAAMLATTHQALGPVTILINNAGLAEFQPFLNVSEAELDTILRINVVGPFLSSQAIVPDMLSAGWGRIVNITSITAQDGNGLGGQVHYAASKGAVISMTRALAMDYADKGITVNHIPPFFVESPRLSEVVADYDAVAAHTPMKRVGRAEEIAGACAFLVSDDAAYVTGQALNVNGGRYLM